MRPKPGRHRSRYGLPAELLTGIPVEIIRLFPSRRHGFAVVRFPDGRLRCVDVESLRLP